MTNAREVIAATDITTQLFIREKLQTFYTKVAGNSDAVISALSAAGFAIVPKVPTLKMCKAGEAVEEKRLTSHVWRAMVEAASDE